VKALSGKEKPWKKKGGKPFPSEELRRRQSSFDSSFFGNGQNI